MHVVVNFCTLFLLTICKSQEGRWQCKICNKLFFIYFFLCIGSEGITFLLHSTLPKVSKCYLMQMEKHFLLCKVLGYYPLQTTSNCMEGGRHPPRTQAVVNISALVSSSINYWVTSFKICDINDKDLTSSIDYVPNRHRNGFSLFLSYSMHLSYAFI